MHRRSEIVFVLSAFCLVTLAGCVTDGPKPAPKPKIGPPPREARADVLLLNVSQPSDTDGDTIPDTVVTSVHMFDERYQLPVTVPGGLTFRLLDRNAETTLTEWPFEGDELQRRLTRAQVGPVYRFRLRIPVDKPPVTDSYVTIQCVMEADSGQKTQAWHRDLPWLSVPR